jgi:hypothetical protein
MKYILPGLLKKTRVWRWRLCILCTQSITMIRTFQGNHLRYRKYHVNYRHILVCIYISKKNMIRKSYLYLNLHVVIHKQFYSSSTSSSHKRLFNLVISLLVNSKMTFHKLFIDFYEVETHEGSIKKQDLDIHLTVRNSW